MDLYVGSERVERERPLTKKGSWEKNMIIYIKKTDNLKLYWTGATAIKENVWFAALQLRHNTPIV